MFAFHSLKVQELCLCVRGTSYCGGIRITIFVAKDKIKLVVLSKKFALIVLLYFILVDFC